jgi:hypothetical protein
VGLGSTVREDDTATTGEKQMNKAQTVFEAIMRSKGMTDLVMVKGKYTSLSMQTRWNYFQLGWEMRGVVV